MAKTLALTQAKTLVKTLDTTVAQTMAKTWAQALVKLKVLMATVKEVGKVEAGAVLAISQDRVRIPTDQDQRPGLLPTHCGILTDPLEATPVTGAMR